MLHSLERLPPFSPVLNRLLGTLARENVSFAELAELIEKDAVLAGNVLRIVNSSLYGLRGTVNSVRHGVAILGVNKLRNIVLSLSITRLWRNVQTPEGWSSVSFNLHSVATGLLADFLVQHVPAPYPEGAFVAGLLHDLGKLLVAISMPREFCVILDRFEERGGSFGACEKEVLGTTHAALSGGALAKWNLPPQIQLAVRNHHTPAQASEGRLDLSHVVEAADLLAVDLGYPALPAGMKRPCASGQAEAALEALGVAGHVPRIVEQFKPELEAMRQYF